RKIGTGRHRHRMAWNIEGQAARAAALVQCHAGIPGERARCAPFVNRYEHASEQSRGCLSESGREERGADPAVHQQGLEAAHRPLLGSKGLGPVRLSQLMEGNMLKEPIFLKPVLQERIWGGTKLREEYGYEI